MELDQIAPQRNVPTRTPPDVVNRPIKEEVEYIITDRIMG